MRSRRASWAFLGIPGHWATPQSLRQARSPRLSHALMTWPGPGKLHEIAFEALKNRFSIKSGALHNRLKESLGCQTRVFHHKNGCLAIRY